MIKVVFVCLGNICRSPMAEGVFQQMVIEAGLEGEIWVDSAGTSGYHAGSAAHPGTQRVLEKHNVPYNGRSRRVDSADSAATYLIAMDQSNLEDLQAQLGSHPHLYKLLSFATKHAVADVPDPYYGGGFDYVYELILDGCEGLLRQIERDYEMR